MEHPIKLSNQQVICFACQASGLRGSFIDRFIPFQNQVGERIYLCPDCYAKYSDAYEYGPEADRAEEAIRPKRKIYPLRDEREKEGSTWGT